MNHDDDGVITRTGDTFEVVFTRRLRRPIDSVWAALTCPERIADWFTEMRFVPEAQLGAGVKIAFHDDPPYRMDCGEVILFDPPRALAWTWPDEVHPQSVVRYQLEADADGCVLTLSQSGLGGKALAWTAAGWHTFLDGLDGATQGVRTVASPKAEQARRPIYEAQVSALA